MEKIIKEHLLKRYPESETESMWEKIQKQYVEFLKDLPYLGGKKNTHNGTGGTYDCIMIFAYYEAFNSTAKSKYNCDPNQPTGYIMKVDPYDKSIGPRYTFE